MFVLLHFVVQQAGRWYIEVGMKRGGPTAKQGCFVFFGHGVVGAIGVAAKEGAT